MRAWSPSGRIMASNNDWITTQERRNWLLNVSKEDDWKPKRLVSLGQKRVRRDAGELLQSSPFNGA